MTTATGPLFLTRGTKAKVDAQPVLAGRILSSLLDDDPTKRRVYVDDASGNRRALAWLDDIDTQPDAPPTPTNTPPVITGLVVTGWQTSVYQSQTVTISISGATDPDGTSSAIKYSLSASGMSASKTSGIAHGESVTLTVSATATVGGTVSLSVVAVDDAGASSQAVVKTATVAAASGSVTLTSTGVVTIPAGVSAVTLRGHGAQGASASFSVTVNHKEIRTNDTYMIDYFASAFFYADVSNVTQPSWAAGNVAFDLTLLYLPSGDTSQKHTVSYLKAVNSSSSEQFVYTEYPVLALPFNTQAYVAYFTSETPATAGSPATVSGAVAHQFAGAASGVTTPPAATEVVKALPNANGHTLTLIVPTGASITVEW